MMIQSRPGDRQIMKIGIITAMPEETGAILRISGKTQKIQVGGRAVHQAQVAGHELTVIEAGMGFDNATKAVRLLVEELRPDMLVSAGFCGGIRAGLVVGDAVLASGLVVISGSGLKPVEANIPAVCGDLVSSQTAAGSRLFAGLFVSTRSIMKKDRLDALLPPDAPCPVVEMESAAIALAAAEKGIPFIGLRTVSDPFDEELGFSLDEFCDRQMRIRIPRVLATIARKPRIIPQLIRLARNSRIAAASLSDSFGRLLAVMP
jgi:adenosylhomocysteine nucleosidase